MSRSGAFEDSNFSAANFNKFLERESTMMHNNSSLSLIKEKAEERSKTQHKQRRKKNNDDQRRSIKHYDVDSKQITIMIITL